MDPREVSELKAAHVRGHKFDPSAPLGTHGPFAGQIEYQLAYLADKASASDAVAPDLLALVEGLLPIAPEWVMKELNMRLVALSGTKTVPHVPRIDTSAWCSILAGLDRAISNGPCGYVKLKDDKGA